MHEGERAEDAARSYERRAGTVAIAAGIGAIVYSVAFLGGVVAGWAPDLGRLASSIALLVGGIFTVTVMVAIYRRLLPAAAAAALLALALVVIGATGATVHGGFDLANAINAPVSDPLADAKLPSPIDPRGLLTFGLSGLGLLLLMVKAREFAVITPRLATLGALVGALMIVVYLGRLIVLDPTNPLVAAPAALTGLILTPAFYIWLGMELRRGR
ncbi:MAG: hypothetical protein M3O78_00970 [Chloroflexota bacterium]|nr:hypothetical protein [Chloroflexota bacterium]